MPGKQKPSKIEIHVTDLKTYLECRRKWDFSSLMRQGLEPKVPYAPFFTGRAIHWCLQQYYESGVLPDKSIPAYLEHEVAKLGDDKLWMKEEEMFNEQVAMISGILQHYLMWAPTEGGYYADRNLRFIALETEYSVPLRAPSGRASNRIYLAGRFDGLVQRVDNETFWLWETKTARSIEGLVDTLPNDMQSGAYLLAAEELFGIKVTGVLYNILRKKIPTTPRLLNNGQLSQAHDMDTTAYHYAETIKATHPDWPLEEKMRVYGEMLNHLIQNGKPFFARFPIRRTRIELENLAQDLHYWGLEMARPSTRITPNGAAGFLSCVKCHFRGPCLAMNAGADWEYILEREYQPRQKWDSLEGIENENEKS